MMSGLRIAAVVAGLAGLGMGAAAVVAPSSLPHIGPPSIAQGITLSNGDESAAAGDLTAALKRRFPIGSPQTDLRDELLAEGFEPDRSDRNCEGHEGQSIKVKTYTVYCPQLDPNILRYTWAGPALCEHYIEAQWSADPAGRITTLDGHYKLICV